MLCPNWCILYIWTVTGIYSLLVYKIYTQSSCMTRSVSVCERERKMHGSPKNTHQPMMKLWPWTPFISSPLDGSFCLLLSLLRHAYRHRQPIVYVCRFPNIYIISPGFLILHPLSCRAMCTWYEPDFMCVLYVVRLYSSLFFCPYKTPSLFMCDDVYARCRACYGYFAYFAHSLSIAYTTPNI